MRRSTLLSHCGALISVSRSPDKSPGKSYAFDLDFFSEIDTEVRLNPRSPNKRISPHARPQNSSKKLNSRALHFVLRKKELKEEYWPRLTKEKARNSFIKTDFSKWVDEDEQEGVAVEADDFDPMGGAGGGGGMPPGMGGMGGMPPGMGGMGGMPGGMDFEKVCLTYLSPPTRLISS